MASKFDSNGRICEGVGCKGSSSVISYYASKKKNLCEDCAEGIPTGQLNLMCDKHDKPMRRYCDTHGHGVCSVCVKRKHRKNKCQLRNIEDAMVDNRSRLLRLKDQLEKKVEMYDAYHEELEQQKIDMFAQLDAIKKNVDDTLDEIIRKDRAREMKEARRITRETDEKNKKLYGEIEKLNAKRRELREKREKRSEYLEAKRAELLAHVQNLGDKAEQEFAQVDDTSEDCLRSQIKSLIKK